MFIEEKLVEVSKIQCDKCVSEIKCQKCSHKSNFAKGILKHNRNIRFEIEENYIIKQQKMYLNSISKEFLIYYQVKQWFL